MTLAWSWEKRKVYVPLCWESKGTEYTRFDRSMSLREKENIEAEYAEAE